jgi:hypothetical protein
MKSHHFPVTLYLRLFGAAGIGYVIGLVSLGAAPTNTSLTIAGISFAMSVTGWFMMRPAGFILVYADNKDLRLIERNLLILLDGA